MSRRLLATVALTLLLAVGCAQAAETDLTMVIDGVSLPDEFLAATVTDVRTIDQLYVELGDGQVTIWVSGFAEGPARGSEVWTAILGPPVPHDQLALVYPSAGILEAPEEGITETGALAVVVGVLALLAIVIPGLTAGALRFRSVRKCGSCGAEVREGWLTCPNCASRLQQPQSPSPPPRATMLSRKGADDESPPAEAAARPPGGPAPDSPAAPDPPAPESGTRIIRRGD